MVKKIDCWDKLTEDEKIMEVICECYSVMCDLEEGKVWSLDEAKLLVEDLIMDDAIHGRKSLPYDANDFYETIHHFYMQDFEELDTDNLYH